MYCEEHGPVNTHVWFEKQNHATLYYLYDEDLLTRLGLRFNEPEYSDDYEDVDIIMLLTE